LQGMQVTDRQLPPGEPRAADARFPEA